MTGRIHSIQSLAASDGPGLRFAVFMQGCPLRCGCCHNPDTWDFCGGKEYTAREIVEKVIRYKSYFGNKGGITVSGGEPLMQAEFVEELFELCHKESINTCLDTSGCVMNDEIKNLLKHTDRVLLDIKYTEEEAYKKYVGCEMEKAIEFLDYLNKEKIPVTLRQVIIPTVNDNEENISKLKETAEKHECVDKIELLPFRKLCQIKYDNMGINFPFGDIPEPSKELMNKLEALI